MNLETIALLDLSILLHFIVSAFVSTVCCTLRPYPCDWWSYWKTCAGFSRGLALEYVLREVSSFYEGGMSPWMW